MGRDDTEGFQQSDMASAIAILPVTAIEQHGLHLPVEVDTAINRGILTRAMALVPAELPVTVLSAETLIRLWIEIGESVTHAGVRKLVRFKSEQRLYEIIA